MADLNAFDLGYSIYCNIVLCVQYSKPVHCQYGKISILINVRIKKCALSDQSPCGNHGVCQEIQKNVLHYATCNCFKGNINNKATFINNFY